MGNTNLFRLTLALTTTTLLMLSGTSGEARVLRQKEGETRTLPQTTNNLKTISNQTKEVTVCANELPYHWLGVAYTAAGTYEFHRTDAAGDIGNTLVLTVLPTETWYPDADGDGYGNGNQPVQVCHAASLYVRNGSDCDDSDPTIRQPIGYFTDADNDGFGSGEAVSFCSSTTPPGFSTVDTDCDDQDARFHPKSANPCRGIQNELNASSVAFFPNPGSGQFSLNRMNLKGTIHLQVFNIQGIQISEGAVGEDSNGHHVLNLQAQPAGIYTVTCTAPGFTQHLRLVIR